MRFKRSLLAVLILAPKMYAQVALVGHNGSNGTGTTTAFDATGGTFASVCAKANLTITDSGSNHWLAVPASAIGGYAGTSVELYIAPSFVPGTSQTFSTSDGSPLTASVFSGVASGPDQVAVSGSLTQYPQVVGPITATNPNELVVGCTNGNYASSAAASVTTNNSGTTGATYTVLDTSVPSSTSSTNGTTMFYTILGSGTPAATSVGVYSTENNGQASNQVSFYSALSPATLVNTSPDPLPEGIVGQAYVDWQSSTVCLTTTGGVAPINWVHSSGTMPTNMTFSTSTGCFGGAPTATVSAAANTFTGTDSQGHTVTASTHFTVVSTGLSLAHTTPSTATQLATYSYALGPAGGTGTYTCTMSQDAQYDSFPEGMAFPTGSCTITSSRVNGQGGYQSAVYLTDSGGGKILDTLTFAVNGNNTFGGTQLYPADSAYHILLDGLPALGSEWVAAYSAYQSRTLTALFGQEPDIGGIPINTVPYTTTMYPATGATLSNVSAIPTPCDAAIEGNQNGVTNSPNQDHHIPTIMLAGDGNPASEWDTYQMAPNSFVANADCSFSSIGYSGVFALAPGTPPSLNSYALPSTGVGTTDAAGLPIAPLLLNYDEVAGGCAVGSECGAVKHPIRFSLQGSLYYYFWPATSAAGLGENGCHDPSTGDSISSPAILSQALSYDCGSGSSPASGTMLNPMGEIFRLKSSVAEPAGCSSNPVNHIIFTGLVHYGLILADNGSSPAYIIGTNDSRWPTHAVLQNCLSALTMGDFEGVDVQSVAANWPNDSHVTGVPTTSTGPQAIGGFTVIGGFDLQ